MITGAELSGESPEIAAGESMVAISRPARKGARLYLSASLTAQAMALVRYVVLARLLGPEQLGLAATLIVTASFFDMISDTGADRFLIQDREGDSEPIQKLVQLVYVTRGSMIAIALAIFAIPLAALYKQPVLAAGFAFLGIARFIRGFLHLDMRRAQRTNDFGPEAKCIIASEVIGLVVMVAAAWFTRSFTAVVWGIIARACVAVVLSHLLAKRRYAIGWDRADAPRLIRFSLPLMISGLMLFIGSQGDRVVVADWLGTKMLGEYSAVLLLIYYPAALVSGYVHALFVPMVAAERDDPERRDKVIEFLGGQTLLLGIGMCAGFALVAPLAVTVLYGHRYTQSALLVALIGILQSTRFLIVWPTTVNLSLGRTRPVLVSNIVRFLAYPGAFVGVYLMGGLAGLVAGFAAGELIAIAAGVVLMNRGAGRAWLAEFDRLAAFALTCGLAVGWNLALARASTMAEIALAVASIALGAWIARREREVIAEAVTLARRAAPLVFARAKAAG
ncbi:MAG: oligosaccharide flippase family protein [Caulobacteraceae bacterium]